MSERKKATPAKRKSKGKRSVEEKLGNPVIFAENFGPIKLAKNVEIKPLTVFVGRSGQGKTYFSIVLASLFRFMRDVSTQCVYLKEVDKHGKESGVEDSLLDRQYQKRIKIESTQLYENIIRNIGVASAKSLKRYRSRGGFKVGFNFEKWNFKADLNDGSHTLSLKKQDSQFMDNLESWIKLGRRIGKPIFLPAGRIGLTQSYHVLAAALLTRATAADELNMPTISGVSATFLQNNLRLVPEGVRLPRYMFDPLNDLRNDIIRHRSEKKEIKDIVKYLEGVQMRIFGGVVKINADNPKQNRTMDLHAENGLTIPVRVGASMLQELAPFFLQVQQLTDVGDTIIIEEPESHLHPEAEREIAKTIAELVKMGMKFVVTTHSPIFLEQIELEIIKSTLPEEDVALYQFNQFGKSRQLGSTAEKIDYDKEDGFIVDKYEDVFSDLHNDLIIALQSEK